jgi:hypothetical protein
LQLGKKNKESTSWAFTKYYNFINKIGEGAKEKGRMAFTNNYN